MPVNGCKQCSFVLKKLFIHVLSVLKQEHTALPYCIINNIMLRCLPGQSVLGSPRAAVPGQSRAVISRTPWNQGCNFYKRIFFTIFAKADFKAKG